MSSADAAATPRDQVTALQLAVTDLCSRYTGVEVISADSSCNSRDEVPPPVQRASAFASQQVSRWRSLAFKLLEGLESAAHACGGSLGQT